MIFEEPLLGITGDGRPMTEQQANRVLAAVLLKEAADFAAVESPQGPILADPQPEAVMEINGGFASICGWHDGARAKVPAIAWAIRHHLQPSIGQCPRCAAAFKAGTWKRLT